MRTSTWCCCRPGVLVAIVLATCLLVSIRENNISEKTMRIIRTALKNFRRYLTIARQQSSGSNSFDKTSSDNINTLNSYNCAKTQKNEHEIVNMAPLATLINARAKVAESFKLIIILAYMHTGSTYIGNLLSQHPGTFYQYEALRNLQMATMAAGRVRYLNGTVVWLKQCEHIDYQLAAEALGHMTSCRHERLDVLTLAANLQPLRKIFNKDVEAYFRCVDPIQRMGRRAQALFKRRKSPIEFIRTERIERCIPLLTNKCKQAKFRIWKFIRLTMNCF
ncbi:uncharacterized protein LOC127876833 [Dreissena polymorpha]|nr:uncharacterized protein LOC127876833 [Dreissena polymorpha]